MAVRKREPEKPKVERVYIADRESGTVCTVGSDVVHKYVEGAKAKFELYDPDSEEDTEETPEEAKPNPPAKK